MTTGNDGHLLYYLIPVGFDRNILQVHTKKKQKYSFSPGICRFFFIDALDKI